MRSRLIASFVGFTIVLLIIFGIPLRGFVERVERERLITSLERDAFILAGHARETLDISGAGPVESLDPYIAEHSSRTDAKVVVTNNAGIVVASNDSALRVGTNFLNRPEINTALDGQPAVGERASETLGEDLVFVAVPVFDGDEILGVVRFSNPQSKITDEVRNSLAGIALAGALTVLAGIALAVPVALGIAQPLVRLRRNAELLASGDFDSRADVDAGPKEVRELASAFNIMSRRLDSLLEGQRQFNSMVSHQLRTPLTALRLRLEFIQQRLDSTDGDMADAVEAFYDELDRLQEIIEQLLKLSRIEAGVIPQVEVVLADVVAQRLEMWKPLAEEHGVAITADVPAGTKCRMIEGGLEQIIDNYIDNAIGVSHLGAVISIRVHEVGQRVRIEVVDEGPGLSDEEKVFAFERFWRSSERQNIPGTGLGLAIVKQIALAGGANTYFADRQDGKNGLRAVVECSRV